MQVSGDVPRRTGMHSPDTAGGADVQAGTKSKVDGGRHCRAAVRAAGGGGREVAGAELGFLSGQ